MTAELAIDIGGTFTDLALRIDNRLHTAKVLTTHQQPAAGVLEGVGLVLQQGQVEPASVTRIIHGTTLATNALIERRGARTALITTAGHRDVLEMAHENRFEQYDISVDRSTPLVPRELRLTVDERMAANGEVLLPLAPHAAESLLPAIDEHQVEAVAIGFLHAWVNPDHEQRFAEDLLRQRPDLSLTLSSDVCPEIREYERLSTACANAYVKPLMARYLLELQNQLHATGLTAPVLMMTSGGGLTTLEAATRYPIRLVESGPAGGAILAGNLAREQNLPRVLSFDMGGTTAKICLIDDGEPQLSRSFEVDRSWRFRRGSGLPVRIPVIEMVEIGAGGGSIAHVDRLGRIQVGPESAGSEPGPAAYGRGGTQPTVTDADLMLGRLHPDHFAAGQIPLDLSAAETALDGVGTELGANALGTAWGISEIVDENMASAARTHAAEWGRDTRERTLIAFGGAAPLHAARLASALHIDHIMVPASAGVGSAVGFLLAPVRFEVVRSHYVQLGHFDPEPVNDLMSAMRAEALAVMAPATGGNNLEEARRGYMRYSGQGHEIAVDLPSRTLDHSDAALLRSLFEDAYLALYGRSIPGLEIEILSWTLSLSAPANNTTLDMTAGDGSSIKAVDAAATLFDGDTSQAALRLHREQLDNHPVDGPLLVQEDQTTTVVPAGFQCHRDLAGHLHLRRIETP